MTQLDKTPIPAIEQSEQSVDANEPLPIPVDMTEVNAAAPCYEPTAVIQCGTLTSDMQQCKSTPAVNVLRRSRKRKAPSVPKLWTNINLIIASGVAILSLSIYLFSSFFWGLLIGAGGVYIILFLVAYLYPESRFIPSFAQPRCAFSGSLLGDLCCSVHCSTNSGAHAVSWPVFAPAVPGMASTNRNTVPEFCDLPQLNIPHMEDEHPDSAANKGPLSSGLGFKLDQNRRPIFRGWMNEINTYIPERHHVNRTHSIFVTLEGTQLRLQRPKRNIGRRSVWTEELPSVNAIRFKSQRMFDILHARVAILPVGLVSKRFWSKKYPIAITISSPSNVHEPQSSSRTLGPSASVPSSLNSTSDRSNFPINPDAINEDGYTVLSSDNFCRTTLYLFGRTSPEKETWYRRLRAASLGIPLLWTPQMVVQGYLSGSKSSVISQGITDDNQSQKSNLDASNSATHSTADSSNTIAFPPSPSIMGLIPGSREPIYVTYVRYMAQFMPASWLLRATQVLNMNVRHIECDPSLIWVNAFLARIFWDFFRESYWLDRIRRKLQAKLKKIHLPQFITDLIIVDIDLGSELPTITRIGKPFLDSQGVWVEVDIAYAGGFSVTLETTANLLRKNKKTRFEKECDIIMNDVSADSAANLVPAMQLDSLVSGHRSNVLGAFASDEEDSVDSTTDSEDSLAETDIRENSIINDAASSSIAASGSSASPNRQHYLMSRSNRSQSTTTPPKVHAEDSTSWAENSTLRPTRKQLFRFVDRITQSSYFQKAVDTKFIQRGVEALSNTPLVLEAKVQLLKGTLVLNIPPPPSDRLWYGFLPNPQLRLKAKPRVGVREVIISRVQQWIENRVTLEFQRLVVLPNMDDLPIPLLLSDVTSSSPA